MFKSHFAYPRDCTFKWLGAKTCSSFTPFRFSKSDSFLTRAYVLLNQFLLFSIMVSCWFSGLVCLFPRFLSLFHLSEMAVRDFVSRGPPFLVSQTFVHW